MASIKSLQKKICHQTSYGWILGKVFWNFLEENLGNKLNGSCRDKVTTTSPELDEKKNKY